MDHSKGDVRSKRKQSPVESSPSIKRQKAHEDTDRDGDYPVPHNDDDAVMSGEDDEAQALANLNTAVEDDEVQALSNLDTVDEDKAWQATTESVVNNVVSIHFSQTDAFDTDEAMSSEATGFVVDAEKGYILTNRHVVCSGPFWGYCIFQNHEECDVFPVYRDPVHDFGFLRFDPKAIKHMQLSSLKLRPDLAKVGVEIRVVGNDAGEKLSILSGVISRLDRNAPEYGEGYCDFNTNYIQAAAAATGGSSGSPVINIDGNVVALQAGGKTNGAATDFFLPLDRPLRALELICKKEHVARGTIQCQFLLKPFDECRRLGLDPAWEAKIRKEFPKETNLLVAEVILPEGPSYEKLEEGDVLIKVNGDLLTQFTRLDDILDSSVNGQIDVLVQRGSKDVYVNLSVGDLHAITPDRYVTVAGASFHTTSYQQARLYGAACKGVYVCDASGSFKFESSTSGWIIISVDTHDTPNLETFVEVMKKIPDRSRIVVTYKHLRDPHTRHTSILYIDRHWNQKIRLFIRNDTTGLWDVQELADPLPPVPSAPEKASFIRMDGVKFPAVAGMIRSFVRVSVTLPIRFDGFPKSRKVGFGLVVDAGKGLVVVSRAIVPYDLCDISITIADSIIVQGEVIFMHPLQNYAIIQYDPSLVNAPVESAQLSEEYLNQGAETIFFAYNQNLRPVVARTSVTDISTISIPASASAPRWRAVNIEAITIDSGLSSQCGSGVLVSETGVVRALWLTYLGERTHDRDVEYHLGFATPSLIPVIKKIQQGVIPDLRILNAEMSTTQVHQARIMGIDDFWIRSIEETYPTRHQFFMVRKVDCDHPSTHHPCFPLRENQKFEAGDIILTLARKLATQVRDLDSMLERTLIVANVLRKREEVKLVIPTVPTKELQTNRVVIFAGAILQPPHHAVRQQVTKIHSGVYVSGRTRGSPAYLYDLNTTTFITAVNGVPTPDLDAFLREVLKIRDNQYFRLKCTSFDDRRFMITMKTCEHYFPMVEVCRGEGGVWERWGFREGERVREGSVDAQGGGGVEV